MNAVPFLCIGVPHLGGLPGYWVKSFAALKKGPTDQYFLTMVENHPVDLARNLIVETFLDNAQATHLLFLDADMTFPRNAVEQLLRADKDIVSGTYFARADTPTPHVYDFVRVDEAGVAWYATKATEFTRWAKRTRGLAEQGNESLFEPYLVNADAVGAGCLLIKREVLERMYEVYADDHYPWFKNHPGSRGGEDFTFCERARALGYEVWADFGVQCAHYAPGGFTGREQFLVAFGIGTENEFDFREPIQFSIGPDGKRRPKLPGVEYPVDLDAPPAPAKLPAFARVREALTGGRR